MGEMDGGEGGVDDTGETVICVGGGEAGMVIEGTGPGTEDGAGWDGTGASGRRREPEA